MGLVIVGNQVDVLCGFDCLIEWQNVDGGFIGDFGVLVLLDDDNCCLVLGMLEQVCDINFIGYVVVMVLCSLLVMKVVDKVECYWFMVECVVEFVL